MILAATPSPGYAFAAGMLATVNPCGFTLLPAYLSYYLGRADDEGETPTSTALLRAVGVGASLTAGFLLVFGIMGVIWSSISSSIADHLPWFTVVMGIAVVVLGIAMLAGFEPVVRLPKLQVGKGGQEAWSTFLFGISYAIASLSCTLPIFTTVLSTSFSSSFVVGVRTFVIFGLGMGALVTLLTLAVALAREGLVRNLRRIVPLFGRISGALLVITGAVVAYYGWAEHQQLNQRESGTGLATALQDAQAWFGDRIDAIGPTRLGLICLGVVATVVGVTAWVRHRRSGPGSGRPSAERETAAP